MKNDDAMGHPHRNMESDFKSKYNLQEAKIRSGAQRKIHCPNTSMEMSFGGDEGTKKVQSSSHSRKVFDVSCHLEKNNSTSGRG